MDTESVKQMWTIMWNFETDEFWLGTVEQALASGMSRYTQRAVLSMPREKFDERFAQTIHKAYRWILIGIVPTHQDARAFIRRLHADRA